MGIKVGMTVKRGTLEWVVTECFNCTPEMLESSITHAAVTGSIGDQTEYCNIENGERVVKAKIAVIRADKLALTKKE